MEIIGTGYTKDIEIGESFLQEQVISMWDFAPKGAYAYIIDGIKYTLIEITKKSNVDYSYRTLQMNEVTDEMIRCLEEKHKTKIH